MNNKCLKKVIFLSLLSICLFTLSACDKDDTEEKSDVEYYNDEDDEGGSGNSNGQTSSITKSKMYISEKGPTSLSITCELGKDANHYYFSFDGKKYTDYFTTSKEFVEKKLRPATTHSAMMLVYNKDKQLIETLVEDFKTSNPPYNDYICVIESYSNPRFFQIDEVTMNTRYDEGAYGTGSRSKHLTMHTTSGDKLVFEYYVHTWDGLYAEWDQGTYNLKYNGNFYEYSAIWVGSSYNPYLNYNKGTLTIKESGRKKIFDFDIDCDESIYGHCEASY